MSEYNSNEPSKDELEQQREEAEKRYKEHLGAGIGLGLISLGAAAAGAVCPLCVVAVPAMLGSGLYQRYKKRCLNEELRTLEGEEKPPQTRFEGA